MNGLKALLTALAGTSAVFVACFFLLAPEWIDRASNQIVGDAGRVPGAEDVANWEQLEVAVMDEDISVMTGVQAGVESSAVDDGGVLTPAWESCIAGFYRYLVSQLERAEGRGQ